MSSQTQLPCDSEGVCMVCKAVPGEEERLLCVTCDTPWHVPCLSAAPPTLAATVGWSCPDCSILDSEVPPAPAPVRNELVAAMLAVEKDASLTQDQKARKRQELMTGEAPVEDEAEKPNKVSVSDILTRSLNCSICIQLPERPVTTPCGHSFCLKCFEKWVRQGKRSCAKCRQAIPVKMASQPRINSALVFAIRMARAASNNNGGSVGVRNVNHFRHNQDRPDEPFTTERAQRNGRANAASGKIFVTVPTDHFGPITAENDPVRNQGLLVGESWRDRLECRQWGAHFVPVGGIAGQSDRGAQSVVLSGGYVDDEDHGEWFLYTGSGGKDLSGNKRTNKSHSFDQKFEKYNRALQVSCLQGYPVRVVRSAPFLSPASYSNSCIHSPHTDTGYNTAIVIYNSKVIGVERVGKLIQVQQHDEQMQYILRHLNIDPLRPTPPAPSTTPDDPDHAVDDALDDIAEDP
ncbi:E3 ubiquitin-protein ligase ORTHRUS 2 [Cajanus cajan]|nr:E3 ubiquitin-protein ligase ORTHRUS 2 [Cajanus cajan]